MDALRERLKARLTPPRRQQVRKAINLVSAIYRWPLEAWRRAAIERRLPSLPGGRHWRTAVPASAHLSMQLGSMNYFYRGVRMIKHPVEIALYMRLIQQVRPASIIEIGSSSGGGAVWMGDLLNTFGISGRVISIDLVPPEPSYVPANVSFLRGDAADLGHSLTAELIATLPRPWLVIEDSSHHYAVTLAAMRFFDPLLQSGEYIVVEDGILTALGHDGDYEGGPARAITEFLQERGRYYEIDASYCDQFGVNLTGNPNGYLRKL